MLRSTFNENNNNTFLSVVRNYFKIKAHAVCRHEKQALSQYVKNGPEGFYIKALYYKGIRGQSGIPLNNLAILMYFCQ